MCSAIFVLTANVFLMESLPRTVEVDEIHDRRINRVMFHTRKNTFSRSHTDAEVCDYAKRSRQSFSRIHIQLDTVAERPFTIRALSLAAVAELFRGNDFARVYIPRRTFDRVA